MPESNHRASAPLFELPDLSGSQAAVLKLGERLFRETRFNEYFYSRNQGNVNAALEKGDPQVTMLPTLGQPFKNPYAGQGMNCASCHFASELKSVQGLGNRAYNDFARRSPIPDRGDGLKTTVRNSPPFVNATLALDPGFTHNPLFLHSDGEFSSVEALVVTSFTGRHFGWLPDEASLAAAHLAKVIREDEGVSRLSRQFGGAYRDIFAATSRVRGEFVLPKSYRLDVETSSDRQIMTAVSKLVAAYIRSLRYARDPVSGEFTGSPYDVFLKKNGLPRKPAPQESRVDYARRLMKLLAAIPPARLRWVQDGVDGRFQLHKQPFAFGKKELQGMTGFFGNCVACHAPPSFADFSFHNTGATQIEYDGIHGKGAFANLFIPNAYNRTGHEFQYLPPNPSSPQWQGQYAAVPSSSKPFFTDLGLWTVVANPGLPQSQAPLKKLLCARYARLAPGKPCDVDAMLNLSVAAFKTPTLRNLGQSAPYLHTGTLDTLEAVVGFYIESSDLARQEQLRSADPEIARIKLSGADIPSLSAFLRSLNEDYN